MDAAPITPALTATCVKRILSAMNAYGAELRRLREEGAGISLRELARHLKMAPAYLSDVERGLRRPFNDDVTRRAVNYLSNEAQLKGRKPFGPEGILDLATEDNARMSLRNEFPGLSEDALDRIAHVVNREVGRSADLSGGRVVTAGRRK
jgi:transcriptional regulator with XRE-family HTH domain